MSDKEVRRLYAEMHDHCANKPAVIEVRRWRETVFKAGGRAFAFMNSPHPPAITIKAARPERRALRCHPAVKRARWIGPLGWLTVTVDDHATLRLARELIDRSYLLVTRERTP